MELLILAQAVPVEVAQSGESVPVTDFSLWSLFVQAHLVVKVVMIGLILSSVWSWAIIIEKLILIERTKRDTADFDADFWSGQSLDDLYHDASQSKPRSNASIFLAAMREWRRSQNSMVRAGFAGLQQRLDKVMDVEMQREMSKLESRLLFLATVGSTAPFIGLFGTVWGIMNSFRAIAVSKNTNLAVVAPGIAEALFATALGLLAAIPAVIFYNKISSEINKLGARMENFSDEFSAIISRQLDERM